MPTASYWDIPPGGPDYGLPYYEPLEWLATGDRGLDGPAARVELADEVYDYPRGSFAEMVKRDAVGDGDLYVHRDHPALNVDYQAALWAGSFTEEQNTRLMEVVAEIDNEIELQALNRGIIGYHEQGEGVIAARFAEFLEEVGYREQLAEALVSVYDDPEAAADAVGLAAALDRKYSEWSPDRNIGEFQVPLTIGSRSPLPGADPDASIEEVQQFGGVAQFATSDGRGGVALTKENNQMIPAVWRTRNGVYQWSQPALGPLEAQPGNSAAAEMIFAKELTEMNDSAARHPAAEAVTTKVRTQRVFLAPRPGREDQAPEPQPQPHVQDQAGFFASLLHDQDPHGWQQAFDETPIRVLVGPGADRTAVFDFSTNRYEPCALGELREALEQHPRGTVLESMAAQRRGQADYEQHAALNPPTTHTGHAGPGVK